MAVSSKLQWLIETAAPYWGGEAEVINTYWSWKARTRETDRSWLARQCFKEFWGAGVDDKRHGLFLGPVEQLLESFPKIDLEMDRHEVLEIAEGLYAEFAHYCAFADAHDGLALPGEAKINPKVLQGWEEDNTLTRMRFEHMDRYGALGRRVMRFTEGGYCTLFSEGMKLKSRLTPGHEKADRLIAEACAKVFDDEFGHMLKGIVGLDDDELTDADWRMLADLSLEQLKQRILMRNAQFGHPVDAARMSELLAGRGKPIAFDYDRAKLAA